MAHRLFPALGTHASTEQQLLARCRRGDWTAFDEIVAQHQNRIYNLCYWMLGDREEAADAAQDAFVRAFRSLESFRGECAFATWLHRIAVNVAINATQRRKRTPLPYSNFENDESAGHEQAREPASNPLDNPQEIAARRERRCAVQQALAEIPEHYRLVLVLFDIEGHSYEKVAEFLDLPLGTVKSRLNRARLALRDKLSPQLELFES